MIVYLFRLFRLLAYLNYACQTPCLTCSTDITHDYMHGRARARAGLERRRPALTLSLSPRKTLEDRGGGSGVDLRKALSALMNAHSLSTVNENYLVKGAAR